MQISAMVRNTGPSHEASFTTNGVVTKLPVPAKADGHGSAVNGGELLMLALATCYCNDLYREAGHLKLRIDAVEVEASADFEGVGLAASNIRYRARVASAASQAEIAALLQRTDAVAEVHNTVRSGVPVQLTPWESGG